MNAIPLYLRGDHELVFAWWHAPRAPLRGALVVQGAWGYEGMCTHWAMARLADALAGHGFAVVRPDWLGTGDSGEPRDGQQFDGWKRTVSLSIEYAKRFSGLPSAAVVGLRLGASVAAAVASERSDVSAMVLLEPAVAGKPWIREQKALAMTSGIGIGEASTAPAADGSIDLLGHALAPAAQEALMKLDLRTLSRAPAPQVLYMPRGDRPTDAKLSAALQKAGASLTVIEGQQLPLLLQDGVLSKEPAVDFEKVSAWLCERFPSDGRTAPGPDEVISKLDGDGFHEEPVVLAGHIAAVGCFPAGEAKKTALLVLNTGANHRVGSHRSSVELMRALAKEGVASMRMDVGGIGDTLLRPGQKQNYPYNAENVADIRTALDWLERRGFPHVVCTGICSGGHLSFHAALQDQRVTGIVLTNTQRFAAVKGLDLDLAIRRAVKSTEHYEARMRSLETWKRLFKGQIDVRTVAPALAERVATRVRRAIEIRLSRTFGSSFERDPVARGFLQLAERGVRMAFVISSEDGARDELAKHLGPKLQRLEGRSGVSLEILEGADHTLTQPWARERLLNTVRAVLSEARA